MYMGSNHFSFVCFVRVSFCHFSLPLGVGGWLRFVIVTPWTFPLTIFSGAGIGKFRDITILTHCFEDQFNTSIKYHFPF